MGAVLGAVRSAEAVAWGCSQFVPVLHWGPVGATRWNHHPSLAEHGSAQRASQEDASQRFAVILCVCVCEGRNKLLPAWLKLFLLK